MAEYIKKERAIELIDEIFDSTDPTDITRVGILKCRSVIRTEQPAVDVVEVVRCKDCKHLMFSDFYGECRQNHLGIVRSDDYCSYGERKEGEDK